jgi:hypothetical protein
MFCLNPPFLITNLLLGPWKKRRGKESSIFGLFIFTRVFCPEIAGDGSVCWSKLEIE